MDLRHGIIAGDLEEVRARGGKRRLRGRFPYGKKATLSAGGRGRRPRKEIIAPRAFEFAVTDPEREIHLLVGHSFDQPLARKGNGSLVLQDSDEALIFEAEITEEIQQSTFWTNFWAAFQSGLMVGLSPGFRIPPPEAVPDADEEVEEDPAEGEAIIQIVRHAVLFELSMVTRPAYDETEVEARSKCLRAETLHRRRLLL